MSEQLHPGVHPDANELSALAEGALSEHERFACLAHLADCSRCREIVYLAQSAVVAEFASEKPVAAPIRGWKRWFAPRPAFTAVAAAFVLVALVAVYRHNSNVPSSPVLTASTRAPAEASPAFETLKQPPTPESTPARTASRANPRVKREPVEAASPAVIAETLAAPPPPPASQETPATLSADTGGKVMPVVPEPAPVTPAAAPQPEQSLAARNGGTPVQLSGIAGTVTDQAGAVVAGARIEARSLSTGVVYPAQTNGSGEFGLTALPPSSYSLQVTVPGFKTYMRTNINLNARDVARLDVPLQVGASAESITVTETSTLLKTESGELAHNVTISDLDRLPVLPANVGARTGALSIAALPETLPPLSTVAKDKLMLSADSTGALLLSKDAGKSWKPVKGRWPGKVVRLDTIKDPANARNTLFQLTTDSASIWLSRDGSSWYPAPVRK